MTDKDTLLQKAANLMDAMKRKEEFDKAFDELLEFLMKDWNEFVKDERLSDEQLT